MNNRDRETAPPDLGKLHQELQAALEEYQHADAELGAARKRHSNALNRLNNKQKELSRTMKILQDNAPHDTDWGRSRQNKEPCDL